MKLLLLTFLLASCSLFQDRDNEPKSPMEKRLELVREKKELYCELSRSKVLEKGYAVSKCDGLLFTSLHAIGCGYPFSLAEFENNGKWFRSPSQNCFETGGATASISKDMIRGMTLYHYVKDSKEPLERFVNYCESNMSKGGLSCKIGEAKDSITAISKTEFPITSLVEIKDFLGEQKLTSIVQSTKDDFLGHLDVLGVLAKGVVYGGIKNSELEKLEDYAQKEPNNALYQGAYSSYNNGSMTKAVDILLNEKLFPADKLPSTNEYCTDYLFQRDEKNNPDWQSCGSYSEHYGTDFIFAASVVLGELQK